MFDQLVPPSNIKRYIRYMSNLKVIIVDRDPRDTYINFAKAKDHVLPKEAEKYCKQYKDVRETLPNEIENKEVLYIKFEDLVYNYEDTTKKIINFLGLSEKNHTKKRKIFIPEISKRNTKQWLTRPEFNDKIEYIESNLKEYLYDFDKYKK